MVICNNNFNCEEDSILGNEINSDNCIAINHNKCTVCETVKIISQDPNYKVRFNKDPIKVLFNEDRSMGDIHQFWDLLKTKCSIEKSEIVIPIESFIVLEPDYTALRRNLDIIKQRLSVFYLENPVPEETKNAERFINTMYKIALTAQEYNENPSNEEHYKRIIKDILERDSCSSQIIHTVDNIPSVIGIFFDILSKSTDIKFKQNIIDLDKRPQICLNGVIDIFLDKLMADHTVRDETVRDETEYKQKYLKYKLKYLDLKNKLI